MDSVADTVEKDFLDQIMKTKAHRVMSLLYLTSKGIGFDESNFEKNLYFLISNGCSINKMLPDQNKGEIHRLWAHIGIAEDSNDSFLLHQRPFAPLHFAADRMPAFVIDALIRHGADKNQPAAYNFLPIHIAAKSRNGSALQALLHHGADPNARDPSFSTALIMACEMHTEQYNLNNINQCVFKVNCDLMAACVAILLQSGANASLVNIQKLNPLHLAVTHKATEPGCIDTITLLLEHKASPNMSLVESGQTPLHVAIKYNNIPAAIMMIVHFKANVLLVETIFRTTALQQAMMKYIATQNDAFVELIQACIRHVEENNQLWRVGDIMDVTSENILDYICVHYNNTYERIMDTVSHYTRKDRHNAAVIASAGRVTRLQYN